MTLRSLTNPMVTLLTRNLKLVLDFSRTLPVNLVGWAGLRLW